MSVESSPKVQHWLSKLKPNTQRVASSNLRAWLNWVKVNGGDFKEFTPDELIEYQGKTDNGSRFKIIDDLVQPYLTSCNVRYHTKRQRYIHIRSFFLHNRVELPKDPTMKIDSDKLPVEGTLTVEDVKLVILACKPAYQAAFLSMFQGAMDQEMFVTWNERPGAYENLVKQIAEVQSLPKEEQIIKIDLPGRKSNRNKKPFYTFIGSDSIDAIRNWLPDRPSNATAIFTDQRKTPLGKSNMRHLWNYHIKRLGLVEGDKKHKGVRTGKGLHEMRDVWRSMWSKSPAKAVVGEYLMGHKIDPLNYDKSFKDHEFYRQEYLKALPKFQIMSSGEPFGQVDVSALEKVRRELKEVKAGQNGAVETMRNELDEVKADMDEYKKNMQSALYFISHISEDQQREIVERINTELSGETPAPDQPRRVVFDVNELMKKSKNKP